MLGTECVACNGTAEVLDALQSKDEQTIGSKENRGHNELWNIYNEHGHQ